VGGHGCWVVGKVVVVVVVVIVVGRLLGVDEGVWWRRKNKKVWRGKGEGRLSRRWGREWVSCARAVEGLMWWTHGESEKGSHVICWKQVDRRSLRRALCQMWAKVNAWLIH
jgi:hypothetical protein